MRLESLAEIARGGMGSVELCRVIDGRLAGHIIAIKRLHANIAEDAEFVSMFLDEAWITAALKHPNVAQVMAWGTDDEGPFLAIELVQGVSLSRLLKEAQTNQEPFAERTVAFICSQICAGLTAAHSLTAPDGTPLTVVHRDLTPANVLVSFDGSVKIIDFGIAKAEERITHTRTGQLKGKPSYMAPEQQRGGVVDHRADLFAFGVTMFELLAGRRPWTAKGAFDVMMEIANDPHPDLGELRKGLNPEFVAIAHRCLEKKAEARFGSAAEIKALFDTWLAAKGFAADDQHSLAQFVQRNSQPQVKWWAEALRGEHTNARKKAPTFKELEERIDEEREKRAKAARRAPPPPPRPAAGTLTGTRPMQPMPPVRRPAPGIAGTMPMSAYQGPASARAPGSDASAPISSGPMSPAPASAQPPSSGAPGSGQPASAPQPMSAPQPVSSSGPPASAGPLSMRQSGLMAMPAPPPAQPASMHQSGLMAMPPAVPQPALGPPAPSAPPPSMAQPGAQPGAPQVWEAPRSLAGTEFMTASPFAGGPPPSLQPPSSPQPPPSPGRAPDPGAWNVPSQRWSHPGPPSQVAPAGTESGTLPMEPALARRTLGAQAPPRLTTPPPPRGRVGLYVLAGVIPLLLAAAVTWFFRDQLLNLLGAGATGDAPAQGAKPAGKAR
jgi:serine/threonine-protein kinase